MIVWNQFISTVAPFLDSVNSKSEADTARIIASTYGTTIQTATIALIPNSTITVTPSTVAMENAIVDTFDKIKQSERPPTPDQFQAWAAEIVNYWSAVTWKPNPPPAGYVSPIVGNVVTSGGTSSPLDVGLYTAFNNPPSSTPMGNVICTKLVSAFIQHLTLVSGTYDGLIPSPTGPVPGPPFLWVGVL